MSMKDTIKNLRRWFLYGYRHSTKSFIRKMNSLGANIDETVGMAVPESVFIDKQAPFLVEIGAHTGFAEGVKILTHDASWLAMKAQDGVIRGHMGPVKIGRHVFVGMNSIIMAGVTVCDYAIIGANSVVSSSITKPGIYAGNPAKLVIGMDEFRAIRDSRQVKEAYNVARAYYERYGQKPPKEIFSEYFWVFEKREIEGLPVEYIRQMEYGGTFDMAKDAFLNSEPDFEGYDAFWDWCMEKIEKEKQRKQKA